MESYSEYVFIVAATALGILDALLLATVVSNSFKLWPVPSPQSWQRFVFWPLFRGGLGLTLLYALTTMRWPDGNEVIPFIIGLICVIAGFGFTIYGYFDLGLANTYGADEGLKTGGLYRYSRNPQYVASIIGFFGVALARGGTRMAVLCGLAILVYVIMPFTEEPWLERVYGEAYRLYKRQTPRFL
jgi:protein-S-isoprenylcysteine O-methyltransferase Ste14